MDAAIPDITMSEQNQHLHDTLAVMAAQQEGRPMVPTEVAMRLLHRIAELEQQYCKNCRFWSSTGRSVPWCSNEKNVKILATLHTPSDFGCVNFEKLITEETRPKRDTAAP